MQATQAALAIPPRVVKFRADYRAKQIPKGYSAARHVLTSLGGAFVVLVACAVTLDQPTLAELTMLPVGFVVANLVEYLFHRFEMHRPHKLTYTVYEKHTLQHHHFYTHDAMAFEEARDFHMVLFPSWLLFALLGASIGPLAALLHFTVSSNAAKLFVIVTVGYYLLYELFHTAYHAPDGHFVTKLPGMAVLRRLHTSHHNLANMGRYNFNITLPIFDLLFGSYKADWSAEDARPSSKRAA